MQKSSIHPRGTALRAIVTLITTLFFPLYSLRPVALPVSAAQARRAQLESYYQAIIQPNTDREAFARLADFTARETGGEVDAFLDDLSWLIMGAPDSFTGIFVGPAGRILERLHNQLGLTQGYPVLYRFGSSGFRVDDRSNQVQHFWFSVIAAYYLGAGFTDGWTRYHEWNAPGLLNLLPLTGHGDGHAGDLRLSRQAIWLGQALRSGSLRPADVPGWIRENL